MAFWNSQWLCSIITSTCSVVQEHYVYLYLDCTFTDLGQATTLVVSWKMGMLTILNCEDLVCSEDCLRVNQGANNIESPQ